MPYTSFLAGFAWWWIVLLSALGCIAAGIWELSRKKTAPAMVFFVVGVIAIALFLSQAWLPERRRVVVPGRDMVYSTTTVTTTTTSDVVLGNNRAPIHLGATAGTVDAASLGGVLNPTVIIVPLQVWNTSRVPTTASAWQAEIIGAGGEHEIIGWKELPTDPFALNGVSYRRSESLGSLTTVALPPGGRFSGYVSFMSGIAPSHVLNTRTQMRISYVDSNGNRVTLADVPGAR